MTKSEKTEADIEVTWSPLVAMLRVRCPYQSNRKLLWGVDVYSSSHSTPSYISLEIQGAEFARCTHGFRWQYGCPELI
jgi:hypothetical protein